MPRFRHSLVPPVTQLPDLCDCGWFRLKPREGGNGGVEVSLCSVGGNLVETRTEEEGA